ncbi:MAG: hypothetical protein AAB345_01370 [Patescibacteria group bacterium]
MEKEEQDNGLRVIVMAVFFSLLTCMVIGYQTGSIGWTFLGGMLTMIASMTLGEVRHSGYFLHKELKELRKEIAELKKSKELYNSKGLPAYGGAKGDQGEKVDLNG